MAHSGEPMSKRHLVLIGMMGAGKSTVGRRVAAKLDRPYFDSDAEIEARTGHTVRELFDESGEAGFRGLESEALADGLASEKPSVIAAAGGTVLDPQNRRRMREAGTVVWLRAEPAWLLRHIRKNDHRPLLEVDPAGVMHRLATERAPLYAEIADHVIDVDKARPADVFDAVLGWAP